MKVSTLRFLLVLVFSVAGLTGCVTAPTTTDGAELKAKQGLLVFHVTSNADAGLSYGDYAPESTFGSRYRENVIGPQGLFRFKAGEMFYVVPLDAGEYMFGKFTVGNQFAWLQSTNRFKVNANAITYVGHINVRVADNRFGLRALDRELEMRTYLAEKYPDYFKKMDFQKAFVELNLK
jgi:hypothetical protein